MIYVVAFVAGVLVALAWIKTRRSTERIDWKSYWRGWFQ